MIWPSNNGRWKVFRVRKAPVLSGIFYGYTTMAWSVAFNHDGTFLAIGGHNHSIQLWPVEEQSQSRMLILEGGQVWSVAFSQDTVCCFLAQPALGPSEGASRRPESLGIKKVVRKAGHEQIGCDIMNR